MEELIALGCRLLADIALGHLVVPTAAVREEGTSYHYFPPSREMTLSPAALTAIWSVLDEAGNRCPTTCRAATTLDPARGQVKPRAAVRRRLRGARTQTPCGRCPVERPRSRERRRATS